MRSLPTDSSRARVRLVSRRHFHWTSGRDVLPEISRLSDVWLVLPVAAPSGIVAWLLVLRRRARIELATLEAASRQFDEQ